MFSNTRVNTLVGGCIVALLILTGCQPGNTTPETTEETVSVPEEIAETVVEVETVEAAQPTVEQPPAEQVVEQSTEAATASPTEEVVDQPTEIATASPTGEVVEPPTEVDAAFPLSAGPVTTYFGDVVEVGGSFISATNIDYPAELENYWPPKDGEKLVAINAIIGITNGDRAAFYFREFSLVDKESFTYTNEIPRLAWPKLHELTIYPGEKARYLVVFKIPESAIPTILKYKRWGLAVGLGAPPEGHQSNSEILNVPLMEPKSKLGETYSKLGYSISAQGVKDPAETLTSYIPKPGEKLIAVDVIIARILADNDMGVSPFNFYLIDNLGYLYPSEFGSIDDEIDGELLFNGDDVRGWVAFRIPEEASPYILKCRVGYGWVWDTLEIGLIE